VFHLEDMTSSGVERVDSRWDSDPMDISPRDRILVNRIFSIEVRQAEHVAYSVGRVIKIPDLVEKYRNQDLTNALTESWLVHARSLCEYFLIHTSRPNNDFSAAVYGWDETYFDEYQDLEKWWLLASQHLMHFSEMRTPHDVFELTEEDLSMPYLRKEGLRFRDLFIDLISLIEFIEHEDHGAFVIAFNNHCALDN